MREASRLVVLPVTTANTSPIPATIDEAMDEASRCLPTLVGLAAQIEREGKEQVEVWHRRLRPLMINGLDQIQKRLATNYAMAAYFAEMVRKNHNIT